MSSFRHPVGPERPSVYWRRRAIALGAVIVVVVVVVLIVVGRGNGATPVAAQSTAPAARTSDRATAASSSSSARPSRSPSPSASAAADGATCTKDQIDLEPVVDKTSYGPTEDPKIAMSITNTGSNSCHMDLGSSQQVLTISSGEEQYWTSKDCQTNGTNQDVTIKAGQKLTTPSIAWDRTRSSTATCDSSRPSVTGGGARYHLQVAVGNIESAKSVQFILQ
ncbi:hypothetical protein JOE58_002797 [Curtobacterium luteum]|uniref:DUF4232 domain-containing protein n=1 Tax=Curtobacterium luteum TaxID=33881 RepID=A0ABS2RX36_9MICO|nr:hypothetical protein [Curtobacterium luteum]MBM7803546.1 hypothetical protein [Curtobacterium luteum]NUU50180.1 hypothetical protein [Curtobacterium luteum]